jgi:antitoxin HigA-1
MLCRRETRWRLRSGDQFGEAAPIARRLSGQSASHAGLLRGDGELDEGQRHYSVPAGQRKRRLTYDTLRAAALRAIRRRNLKREEQRAQSYGPSGRITGILNATRDPGDTARLGRYFVNTAQFWLDLQSQHDIAVVEREKGAEIKERVRPAKAA